jgi:hypothetical protein
MTIKYMHIRVATPDGEIYPCGGVTIAYIVTQDEVVAAWTKCRSDELFCFKTGRAAALDKLQAPDGDVEVFSLEHPLSDTLADWIATDVWPNTLPEDVGYSGDDMGFAIDVYKDNRGRWFSTFEPAQGLINFGPDFPVDEEGLLREYPDTSGLGVYP